MTLRRRGIRTAALVIWAVVVSIITAPQPVAAQTVSCKGSVGPGIAAPSQVEAGIPGFHAAWYGQSGYPTLCPGERATSVVAYYNSGTRGWLQGRLGEAAYLGTWDDVPGQDRPSSLGGDGTNGSPNTGWPRFNRIAQQPAAYVGPGQVAWFTFTIQAPQTPGVYKLYLRPLVEGATWMEDYGVFWIVTVLNLTGTAPPPPATGLTYNVSRSVDASTESDVRFGASRMRTYMTTVAGSHPAGVVRVELFAGSRDGNAPGFPGGGCCLAVGSTMYLNIDNPLWLNNGLTYTPSTIIKKTAAHEYVHNWQYLSAAGLPYSHWIIEGGAEYFAYEMLFAEGLVDRAQYEYQQLQTFRDPTFYISLKDLETTFPVYDKAPYSHSYVAVSQLAAKYGAAKVAAFWSNLRGQTANWRAVFQQTFGVSLESFYADIEAYRKRS